jgi:single-stranded-DNA-specific exonuclease
MNAVTPRLVQREVSPRVSFELERSGLSPLMARLLAARGVRSADEAELGLAGLLPPSTLKSAEAAGQLLADALAAKQRIVVVADYDCDGATACAVAVRGLRMLGGAPEHVDFVVPDRAIHGYGLTPPIVDLAVARGAQLLVTVDNGIASIEGVAHARRLGLRVLITDHHLPAQLGGEVVLPDADVIVNPNQPGDTFASRAIAGVGVMFYVLLAVRAELRRRGTIDPQQQPRLDRLLDLVALGTVADVVRLDANNRRLVTQGLQRIRAGRLHPGLLALCQVAGIDPARLTSTDIGFKLGPRINAAGRLSDMTLGIACLLCDDPVRALELAQTLDRINQERRDVEADMRAQAQVQLDDLLARLTQPPPGVCLFDEGFHEGVVGIVAGRVKDRLHRPTFVFARSADGTLKGSGRSIDGFHLRDALDLVSKRAPGVLLRFGGHAAAAGASLKPEGLEAFSRCFAEVAQEGLSPQALERVLLHDGPLPAAAITPDLARQLGDQVWGSGFETPLFVDEMDVLTQTLLKDKHLKLRLRHGAQTLDAIWFQRTEPLPSRARLAYRVQLNEWGGQSRVQLQIEAMG